ELADGLAHAHERGVLHRDIKPANVLLTDDGRPMLLDFNLAVAKAGQLCGTPAYMAPEQLEAARADRGIGTIQTDIYSLGLVLLELLAGRAPFEQPGGSWPEMLPAMIAARKQPPLVGLPLPHAVTPGVRAILSKCLDPDPRARYESAIQLREDLERQRTNLPLRFAREGSIRERMRKWSRRHPRLSSVATVSAAALVVIVGITTALLANQQHLRMMKAESARRELRDARESIQAAIPYGPSDPDLQWLEVLATAESALAPYQVADDGWVNSSLVTRLPEAEHAALRRDAAEVMFRAAEAAASLAALRPGDRERYLNHALEWNRRARHASPEHDTRDFLAQQARLLRSASRTEEAERVAETALKAQEPASDDLAVQARAELDAGRYPEAARKYREAARSVEPRYSLWMGLAAAEMKLRHFESAIDALSAAAAIRPASPWPHYHRGVARLELNNPAGAIADFDRFLELRPADPDGLLNRAAARYLTGGFRGAVADLDAAEQHGSTRTRLFALRETAKRRLGDHAGADRDRKTFLESNPTDALSWNVRGEWKRNSHPRDLAGAIADFDEAL
ncbi:MAG TPA: protein kinase, partial [Gemmata sp.]|nr:protein kinase [Gemmata sp.]